MQVGGDLTLRRRLRYLGEYAALRVLTGILGRLPIDTASDFGAGVGRFVGIRVRKHRRVLRHLRRALKAETTPAERQRIALSMWAFLGRTFVEAVLLRRIAADPERFEIAPDALALLPKTENSAAVFVGAHYGNWEVAACLFERLGYRPAGLYRRLENPYADGFLYRRRKRLYPSGLLGKEEASLGRLMAMARAGVPVGMLCDQRERRGIMAAFLGAPAPTSTAPALIALRLGIPLLAFRVLRLPGTRFRLEVEPIDVSRSGRLADDIRITTERINARFSDWIREHPDHWMWTHRRWGRQAGTASGSPDASAGTGL